MRMRHTSRTDPQMGGDRKQVSFRLDADHRERMKEVVKHHFPDLHNESDIMQDAVWLWFHEYDLMTGSENGSRSRAKEAGNRVDAGPGDGVQEAAGVEVGDAS